MKPESKDNRDPGFIFILADGATLTAFLRVAGCPVPPLAAPAGPAPTSTQRFTSWIRGVVTSQCFAPASDIIPHIGGLVTTPQPIYPSASDFSTLSNYKVMNYGDSLDEVALSGPERYNLSHFLDSCALNSSVEALEPCENICAWLKTEVLQS